MSLLDNYDFNEIKSKKDEDILFLSLDNPSYFSIIIDRYREAFLRKARSIVGDRDDIHDIVQEAFTKIYLNAGRFEVVPGASFKSWAYKILINVTFTWYGRLKKDRETTVRLDPELDEVIPDKKTSGYMESETIKDYVISVLVRMPDNFSRALKSYFIEGKSQKEIAEEEGVTVEAIKTRICRAKKEFRLIDNEMASL